MNINSGDDDAGEIFVQYSFTLMLSRFLDNYLLPTYLSVSMDMHANPEADDDQFHLAMTKIRYWLDHVATKSVAVSASNSEMIRILIKESGGFVISNSMMLTPDEPMDDLFALLLQSKLNALADGVYVFGNVRIESDNESGMSFNYIGNAEEDLPEVNQWLDGLSWYDEPWWRRNDATMIDSIVPADADRDAGPPWAASLDFLAKALSSPTANIRKADFRPRLIEGGKKKEKEPEKEPEKDTEE